MSSSSSRGQTRAPQSDLVEIVNLRNIKIESIRVLLVSGGLPQCKGQGSTRNNGQPARCSHESMEMVKVLLKGSSLEG